MKEITIFLVGALVGAVSTIAAVFHKEIHEKINPVIESIKTKKNPDKEEQS